MAAISTECLNALGMEFVFKISLNDDTVNISDVWFFMFATHFQHSTV